MNVTIQINKHSYEHNMSMQQTWKMEGFTYD